MAAKLGILQLLPDVAASAFSDGSEEMALYMAMSGKHQQYVVLSNECLNVYMHTNIIHM